MENTWKHTKPAYFKREEGMCRKRLADIKSEEDIKKEGLQNEIRGTVTKVLQDTHDKTRGIYYCNFIIKFENGEEYKAGIPKQNESGVKDVRVGDEINYRWSWSKNKYFAEKIKKCKVEESFEDEAEESEIAGEKSALTVSDILKLAPTDLFKEELEETEFQTKVLEYSRQRGGFKKHIFDAFNDKEPAGILNIQSKQAFRNITSRLYDDDKKYQNSLLMRFKPFFDTIVPYLYVVEIEKNPEMLEEYLLDYCDFLNTLIRTRQINKDEKIDSKNTLLNRFRDIAEYYVNNKPDRVPDISDDAKRVINLAIDGKECCQKTGNTPSEEASEAALLHDLYERSKKHDCYFDYDYDYSLILSLIESYKDSDPIKARFLYSHFLKHRRTTLAENGQAEILDSLKIEGMRKDDFANDVVYDAFNTLLPSQLFDFLKWASPMFLSPWAGDYICDLNKSKNQDARVYSYYFAKILMDASDFNNWKSFHSWFMDKDNDNLFSINNKHVLCVCIRIVLDNLGELESVIDPEKTKHDWSVDTKDLLRQLLRKNTHKKNLIYYAAQYISDSGNDEIISLLLNAINRGYILVSETDTSAKEIRNLCACCEKKLNDSPEPIYADLLVKIKGERMTWEEVENIAPITRDKAFISNRLFAAFDTQTSAPEFDTKKALLNALYLEKSEEYQSSTSSYTGRGMKKIWTDILKDDEQLEDWRQICINVLKDYPSSKALRLYISGIDDNVKKTELCKQFVDIYSEQMVGKLFKETLDFDAGYLTEDENKELLDAYLDFISEQCRAQLVFNCDYEDFYLYRRYLKLAVVDAINGINNIDGIKQVAQQHDHISLLESFGFDSFCVILGKLLEELKNNEKQKKHLLLSFITEDMSTYFEDYQEAEIDNLKLILRHFDFREIQSNFFKSICDDEEKLFSENQIESQLSDEMIEVIDGLYIFSHSRKASDKERFQKRLDDTKKAFEKRNYAQAISDIIDRADKMINDEDRRFWISVILAKQLPSKVIGEARRRVLNNIGDISSESDYQENSKAFAFKILERMGSEDNKGKSYYYPNAAACKNYLELLDKSQKQQTISDEEISSIITDNLPEVWKEEAERFKKECNTGFVPDEIAYRSFGRSKMSLSFPDKLRTIKIPRGKEKEEIDNLIRSAEKLATHQQMDDCDITPQEFKESAIKNQYIPAGIKLTICLELYQRFGTGFSARDLKDLADDLSIEDWLNNHRSIYSVMQGSFQKEFEYLNIIREELGVDSLNKCSVTQLLRVLEGVPKRLKTTNSDNGLMEYIKRSIQPSIDDLKKRKLVLEYEGNSCDFGKWYSYFRIKNEGEFAINLKDRCEVKINDSYVDFSVEFDELHPGWKIGFRCPLEWQEEEKLDLSLTIFDKDRAAMPLCRETFTVEKAEDKKIDKEFTYLEDLKFIENIKENSEKIKKDLEQKDCLCLEYLAKRQRKEKSIDLILNELKESFGESNVKDFLERACEIKKLLNENNDFSSTYISWTFEYLSKEKTSREIINELEKMLYTSADKISEEIKFLDQEEQKKVLQNCEPAALANAVWENANALYDVGNKINKSGLGNVTIHGDYINASNGAIGKQVNINQTVKTLLLGPGENPQAFLEAFSDFLNPLQKNREALKTNEDALKALIKEADNELNTYYEDKTQDHQEKIDKLEEEIANLKKTNDELIKQQASGLLSSIDIDDLFTPNKEKWKKLIHVTPEDLANIKDYFGSLNFAVSIHSVLASIYENILKIPDDNKDKKDALDKFDFSPAALMYCKVVESMLNDKHKELYKNSEYIGEKVYNIPRGTRWKEIGEESLEIGKFWHVIGCGDHNGEETKKDREATQRVDREESRKSLSYVNGDFNDRLKAAWDEHTKLLSVVRDKRNRTAHASKQFEFNKDFLPLIDNLFGTNGEIGDLLLIWQLAHPDSIIT